MVSSALMHASFFSLTLLFHWVMNMSFLGPTLTVEEIFKDYRARRLGIMLALTQDDDKLYELCDPANENDLCLYGNPDETWEVRPPPGLVPPGLPDPRLAINVNRDAKDRITWLNEIALYSHPWLLSVAFFFAARLNSNERKRLFDLINNLPTVIEMVGRFQQIKHNSNMASESKSQRITKRSTNGKVKRKELAAIADDSKEICGRCGENENVDEFWIACDTCDRWFHGACVDVTAAKAGSIKKYKCPSCNERKQGLD